MSPTFVNLPQHIAITMDGNGRWAAARGVARAAGHKAGLKPVRMCVEECTRLAVPALTLFAFSSENWGRPAEEVGSLMSLFVEALDREILCVFQAQAGDVALRGLAAERHGAVDPDTDLGRMQPCKVAAEPGGNFNDDCQLPAFHPLLDLGGGADRRLFREITGAREILDQSVALRRLILVEGRKFLRSQRRLNLIDDAVEPDEQFCLVFDPGLIMVANGFGKGRHGYGF